MELLDKKFQKTLDKLRLRVYTKQALREEANMDD